MQIGYYHIPNLYVNQQFNNLYVYAKPKHCYFFPDFYRGINHTVIAVWNNYKSELETLRLNTFKILNWEVFLKHTVEGQIIFECHCIFCDDLEHRKKIISSRRLVLNSYC